MRNHQLYTSADGLKCAEAVIHKQAPSVVICSLTDAMGSSENVHVLYVNKAY